MKLLLVVVLALAAAVAVAALSGVRADDAADGAAGDASAADTEAAAAPADGDALFTAEQRAQMEAGAQKHEFNSDVSKLLAIIVHSLYSKPEVFLRELISNANDALDKIRFLSLTDKSSLGELSDLKIELRGDEDANTLTIRDYGTGMTAEQLASQLGTIARSGTKEFVQKYAQYSDSNLIGQFGVGFYSAFLVADTVTVVSKHNDDAQHVWQSTADGSFTVVADPRGDTLGRGTEITLHLKEDAAEYAKVDTVKQLVAKYSEFITFPIYVWASHDETNDVELSADEIDERRRELVEQKRAERAAAKADEADGADDEAVDLDAADADAAADDAAEDDIEIDEDEIEKTKSVTETVWAWDRLNDVKPLWTRSPREIGASEYKEFYKTALKDYNEPSKWTHFAAEGEIEFKALLYVPSQPPSGMFEGAKREALKLYVRRVFISDDFSELMPKYLAFLKGIVDSDDLPLNVSREQLQQSKVLKLIKKRLVRKAIAMFQELKKDQERAIAERDAAEADDDADKADNDADNDADKADDDEHKPTVDCFDKFYEQYATSLKLGVIEDAANRARLSKLLKFHSSTQGEPVFLDDYVSRMADGQEQIYFLGGESIEAVAGSPLLERAVRRNIEVLYMVDPIDEYALQHLHKYDGKYTMANLGKEGTRLPGEKAIGDEQKERFDKMLSWMKLVMPDKVEKVTLSTRLTTSPSAIVTSAFGYSASQERIVRAQALGDPSSKQGFMMNSKRHLELNPASPIVQELNALVDADESSDKARRIAEVLYDTALLTSGFSVTDTAAFASRVNDLLAASLTIDAAQPDEDAIAELDAQVIEAPAAAADDADAADEEFEDEEAFDEEAGKDEL